MEKEPLQTFDKVLGFYDILESIHLDEKVTHKLYLGKEPRKCRFCELSDVTFEKDAHAFPEFIGNKYLLSHHECDTCNKEFGENIETDMANFMLVNHSLAGVQGKGGKIPNYQRSGVKLNSDGKHLDFKNVDVDNLNDGQFTINLTNPAFVPIAVYKCLTKMALTLMPEEELDNFSDTFKWIKEKQHKDSNYVFDSLISFYSYSRVQFPFITAILLKRKEQIKRDIPYIIFRLTYANFSFQTYIPLCRLDKVHSYPADKMLYVPHLTDIINGFMASERIWGNFNVSDRISSNMTKIEIKNLDK
jgi:hypothetical protein